jgi:hemolysin activation/secretion protein
VSEFRVKGATSLSEAELEAAVSPFLGPARTLDDVERARAALEKAYSERGWHAVTVAIPPQKVRDGVVMLEVTEGTVARLRVRGARWFSPADIRRHAPSLAEGAIPNFDHVVSDVFDLNQIPDRRVTPSLRAGVVPGTIDADLVVEDHLPLHGSVEMNDRYSPGTTPLRVNTSLRYDNLFQLGHSLAFSFQTAPQRPDDGKVYLASYLARIPELPRLSVSVTGLLQNSDISTLGGSAVAGKGKMLGGRVVYTLPAPEGWFHTAGAGVDYKEFLEKLSHGGSALETPVTYWPVTVQYSATHEGSSSQTQLGSSLIVNLRMASSAPDRFDAKRYGASGNFVILRGDAARTDDLWLGLQLHEHLVLQWTPDPVVGSEQLAAGGIESVRGYLEAQGLGDYGATTQVELRSPSLSRWFWGRALTEWRFHVFVDAGAVAIHRPLPEQTASAVLLSTGGGTRLRVYGHVAGALEAGVPLRTVGTTARHTATLQFRVWSEF